MTTGKTGKPASKSGAGADLAKDKAVYLQGQVDGLRKTIQAFD